MNVLFLTLVNFRSLEERNIYTDLLREFRRNEHNVFCISPVERKNGKRTEIINEKNTVILKLLIGNTQKTNIIEKGISTVMIEPQFKAAIKKHFSNVKFDLVLYSTPPITLAGAVKYVKTRDNAKTYLLLKDIFPQNAVDIRMMSTTGVKGLLYRHFRKQEKKLYAISDRIGCMSRANVDYLVRHNPEIAPSNIEICPNCVEVVDRSVDEAVRRVIRNKYGIPFDKKVFVYGGNLGKPQDIPFIIECLRKCEDIGDAFFLIIGAGTEYGVLEKYIENDNPRNVKLMRSLSKEDYEMLVGACDVGLIFLDHRFTIPNFPSRLLSYLQAKIPVLAVTDPNTDIGNVITGTDKCGNYTHEPFGWWCESSNAENVMLCVKEILVKDIIKFGENGFKYLEAHYSAEDGCKIIIESVKQAISVNN